MLQIPISKTVTAAPEKIDVDVKVGRKAAICCKSASGATALVYLVYSGKTPLADDYTAEIAPGNYYEVPEEHSGDVWVAGLGGSADITITQYG